MHVDRMHPGVSKELWEDKENVTLLRLKLRKSFNFVKGKKIKLPILKNKDAL